MIKSTCTIGDYVFHLETFASTNGQDANNDMLRLFAKVFGQEQDLRWHAWKYIRGGGEAVALRNEMNELVAHWGGLPRHLLWQGRLIKAVQNCDAMVAPQVRGLLTRRGPLFQVCSHFLASRVGDSQPYALAFGFPNQRHMKLLVKLNLFYNVCPIHLLRWPAQQKKLGFGWRWTPLPECPSPRLLQTAWQVMARDLMDCVLGVREADYLRWRFYERPDCSYQLFLLSRWPIDTPTVVVLRQTGETMELLDIIGPCSSFNVAIQAARGEAARVGVRELTAWASPCVMELLGAEAIVGDSGASLAVAKASTVPVEEIDAARWWWMAGDTDFL